MRLITVFRALAWLGVIIAFWSLNMAWGDGPEVPERWQRAVVGASLAGFLAALAISVSGRRLVPPSWPARGIATFFAAVMLVVVLSLRSKAVGIYADYDDGPGWTWLLAGSGIVAGAVLGTFGLRLPEAAARREARKAARRGGKRR